MVDAISNGTDIAALATAQKQQAVGAQVEVAVFKKAMDTQTEAMLQLLNSMGVGNNVNELA